MMTMLLRGRSMGEYKSSAIDKASDDVLSSKSPHSTVTYVFSSYIGGCWRKVTVLWSKNMVHHSLTLTFNNIEGEIFYTCKVDLKPWLFWVKKGTKSVDIEGFRVDIFWDLRAAKFATSPEPLSDYYVAVVSEEEVALLLGDVKKKAYKRTKARPALVEPILYHKKEYVYAKKSFVTRARLEDRNQDNEIVVESSTTTSKEPEMWISIDGVVVVHVKNLQWKFRGNQIVMTNTQQVHIYWDVHDWLFNNVGITHGLFIFKPEAESDKDGSSHGTDSDVSDVSKYFSTKSTSSPQEFCLFLHAWKMD